MWFPIVAWIVLVSAAAFFAGATLNLNPSQISIHFAALPGPQRFALGAILFTTLALIGSSVWQAFGLARQNKRGLAAGHPTPKPGRGSHQQQSGRPAGSLPAAIGVGAMRPSGREPVR